jgi:hypothetical protein
MAYSQEAYSTFNQLIIRAMLPPGTNIDMIPRRIRTHPVSVMTSGRNPAFQMLWVSTTERPERSNMLAGVGLVASLRSAR